MIIPSVYDSNPVSVPGYDEVISRSYIDTYYYENNGILDIDMEYDGEEEEDVIWLNVRFLLDRDIFVYASNFVTIQNPLCQNYLSVACKGGC